MGQQKGSKRKAIATKKKNEEKQILIHFFKS
jgi:hypothetical protein